MSESFMSLPINIEEVIRGRSVEWERLEFKKGWNPEPVLHTLCAFANDFHNLGGGYIFIGVAQDEGRPVLPPAGLPSHELDHVQKEVLRLGYLIQPDYHPIVEPYVIDGKNILVLWSPGGPHRPYKAPESLSQSNRTFPYYIRKSSSTVKARHADEVELMSLAARVPFDDRVNQNARTSDLKASLMQTHLRDIGSQLADEAVNMSFEQICRRMNIVDGPQEHLLPRNVGLM
ncbi:MAG: ATP-binding protein, partial [Pyrinomonadaceae bacterium]|nr:ATP-binding protein [Pyrinomonadaceae bacterium]